jgi:hypothetical protein
MTETAASKPVPPTEAQLKRAAALAAKLLQGRGLGKRMPVAANAIGKALATTEPRSGHGQLLVRTLRSTPDGAERPDDELAVLNLARYGTTPTAAAVAGEVQGLAARRARLERLNSLAAPIAEADGTRAAAFIARTVETTGIGPTWVQLARELGWPEHPWGLTASVVWHLRRAGWVTTGKKKGSIHPGPRATEEGQ